jgi:SAM-dependent methyltransferase
VAALKPVRIDERLDEGAPLQLRLAETLCANDCAWYHGPRQYLRALEIVPGIGRDSRYFADTLQKLAREGGFSRVLISGSADCGILAHVSAAYAAAGAALHITCVDRCGTPIAMNQWYASSCGVPIDAHQVDVVDFTPKQPFDLVCTHGFLGWFAPAARREIVATWHRVLRPGGVVLTASGLRAAVGLTADESRSFQARGRLAHAEAERRFRLDAETIDRWTDRYARRTTAYMPVSIEDVQTMFAEEGFTFRELLTVPGPGATDLARIRIVAERAQRPERAERERGRP